MNLTPEQQVFELRRQIVALDAEMRSLYNQPRCRAAVVAAVDAYLEVLAERGKAVFYRSLEALASGLSSAPLTLSGTAGPDGVARVDVGPLLVAVLGVKKVREAYLADIDIILEGLPLPKRNARLEELQKESNRIETLEEMLVIQCEEEGLPIPRRFDARPEIVLAVQHEH